MRASTRFFPLLLFVSALAHGAPQERWLAATQSLYSREPAGGDVADNRLDLQTLNVDARLWQGRSGPLRFDVRLEHAYIEYDFAVPPTTNLDVHTLRFPLSISAKRGPWALSGFVSPGVSTSSNVLRRLQFNADDFTTTAGFAARLGMGGAGSWVIGAAIDRNFGDTRLYPVLGIEVEPNARWQFSIVLPQPSLSHAPHPRFRWSLCAGPAGNRWQVLDDERQRRFVVRARGWRADIRGWHAVGSLLWLSAGVAREWNRELEFVSDSGAPLQAKPAAAWRISAGFVLGAAPPRPTACR